MFELIERSVFIFARGVSLLFAMIAFVAVMMLGVKGYQNMSGKLEPTIEFSQYQQLTQTKKQEQIAIDGSVGNTLDQYIDTIVDQLTQLPDNMVDKLYLTPKVKVLLKSNGYSPAQQLSYAASFSVLIQQMLDAGDESVSVDGLIKWHDREFARQKYHKNSQSDVDQMMSFGIWIMLFIALGVFQS